MAGRSAYAFVIIRAKADDPVFRDASALSHGLGVLLDLMASEYCSLRGHDGRLSRGA
jgi:hypothetical protein